MSRGAQSGLYGWTTVNATQAHDYIWPAILRLLPPKLGPQSLGALDLGCGNGYIASRLHAIGYRVTGVDLSPDGITLARQAYPDIRFEVASIYDDVAQILGETDFDLVVSSEVIEHLYFPRKLLQNAYRILRPGGSLIVTTPYHGYLKNLALSLFDKWDDHHTVNWDGGHIKFFSEGTLTAFLKEAGFTDIRFSNAGRTPWLWKSIVCRATKGSNR
jgi:2-polyprenyl-3-methyl-5-hydroxy-6-metoxy-1,4-benzoquinol methylase